MITISTSTLVRYWNNAINAFWNMVPKGLWQKSVFRMGVSDPATGLQGYAPVWVYMESPVLAAGDSDDAQLELQEGFCLMGVVGESVAAGQEFLGNNFAIQLYDVVGQRRLMTKPILNGNFCGGLGTALFQDEAYEFEGTVPGCQVRLTNLRTVTSQVQIALYGLVPSPGL
jgi:hypothetical protein